MAEIAKLITPVAGPSAVPETLFDRWLEGITKSIEEGTTKRRLMEVIEDPDAWETNVAGPSSKGFSPMIDPNFVSRSGLDADQITQKQRRKLSRAHQDAIDAIEKVYENGAEEIKKKIEEKKERWLENVVPTLASTGNADDGKGSGPSVAHVRFWTADNRLAGTLGSDDVYTGDHQPSDPFVPTGIRQQFSPALMSVLPQGIVSFIQGSEVSGFNSRLEQLLSGFLDSSVYAGPPDSKIELVDQGGDLEVHSVAATP